MRARRPLSLSKQRRLLARIPRRPTKALFTSDFRTESSVFRVRWYMLPEFRGDLQHQVDHFMGQKGYSMWEIPWLYNHRPKFMEELYQATAREVTRAVKQEEVLEKLLKDLELRCHRAMREGHHHYANTWARRHKVLTSIKDLYTEACESRVAFLMVLATHRREKRRQGQRNQRSISTQTSPPAAVI